MIIKILFFSLHIDVHIYSQKMTNNMQGFKKKGKQIQLEIKKNKQYFHSKKAFLSKNRPCDVIPNQLYDVVMV